MKQEITLTQCVIGETGSVEVAIDWNGVPHSAVFPDAATLAAANADIMTSPEEAIRWLLFYLLNTGITPDMLPSSVGKKLVVNVAPAVQQTIALVG